MYKLEVGARGIVLNLQTTRVVKTPKCIRCPMKMKKGKNKETKMKFWRIPGGRKMMNSKKLEKE